ncbi:unnamed protein product [Candida verbasci]|uniref:PCI domain-containing protein n=1 Tax=Candida verbasci TaxID=1227364 RepID=A0A9W4XHQ7_9ASCO|nr:unnamed protein product [Candida verbasci]
MSRFFASGYASETSSEEEDLLSTSEEELLSSSDEEQLEEGEDEDEDKVDSDFFNNEDESSSDDDEVPTGPTYFLKKSFLKGSAGDSDSESDDEGRSKIVKSSRDKVSEEMKSSISLIKTESNWNKILIEFDKLIKLTSKYNNLVPKSFISLLGHLNESKVQTADLSSDEAKSFVILKQRVKKQLKEFQSYYDSYIENPENFDSDEPLTSVKSLESTDNNQGKEYSLIFKTLKEVKDNRGKKNVDKHLQIQMLEELFNSEITTFESILIYQMLLSIRFDASSNQAFMPLDQWQKNLNDLIKLLDILEKDQTYVLSEKGQILDEIDVEPEADENGVKTIYGSITSYIDRIDDEFTKSLNNIDAHSNEYIDRLKDEIKVYSMIIRGLKYIESIEESHHQINRLTYNKLKHLYYKSDKLIKIMEKEIGNDVVAEKLIKELVDKLADDENYRDNAILFHSYYLSLNNNFSASKDLFIKSKLASDQAVNYNRALVQLALCSFRLGNIAESITMLTELINSQRIKELLAQSIPQKFGTPSDKSKFIPFHQQINIDLLECVYTTATLLHEVPLIALNNKDLSKKKDTSLRTKLQYYQKQFFQGPPESTRDYLIHSAIALQKGDWKKSYNLISSIKLWNLFSNHEELLSMLKNQLQVQGLKTYIYIYKTIYTKLSIDKLSTIFELTKDDVIKIVNEIIELGNISGSISNDFIVFDKEITRSKLQESAIKLNGFIQLLSEKNEKTGSNGYGKKQNQQQNQQPQQQEQSKEQADEKEKEISYRYANVVNDF